MYTDDMDKKMLLLQLNDSLFPIGAYAHSYGMETYVQLGLVNDTKSVEAFMKKYISAALLYNDLLAVSLAYDAAEAHSLERINNIDKRLTASKNCTEIREAGQKLGTRFIKTVKTFADLSDGSIFAQYSKQENSRHFHQVAYGVFAAAHGIEKKDALAHYLYAQTSSMVINFVKLVPLRQTDGQGILFRLQDVMCGNLKEVSNLDIKDLCRNFPGFDLRSMQHETLYSRLFMS